MNTAVDHLLIVDDDKEIRSLLTEYLSGNGYRITAVQDGQAMHRALELNRIDLVVLDLMLPGEDGLTLCREIRSRFSSLPVLILTAKGDEIDRIVGLEMGADDYLAKPFNPRELLARIKSVLRRSVALPPNLKVTEVKAYKFSNWTLDILTRNLQSPDGLIIPLSGAEYRLFRVFLDHPQKVLNRDQLLELANKRETVLFDRSIDVLVGRIRNRLKDEVKEPIFIKTIRGEGYVFSMPVDVV